MALLSFFNLANEKLEVADKWLREQVANLATVATTGSYNDLSDRPNIGTTDISGIGDGTITGAIDTINSNLIANSRASEVNITSYTSVNPYTAPTDGYVQLRCVGSGNAGQVEVDDANGNYLAQIMISTDAGNGIQSLFVRKGMKIYSVYLAGTTGVSFRGLS